MQHWEPGLVQLAMLKLDMPKQHSRMHRQELTWRKTEPMVSVSNTYVLYDCVVPCRESCSLGMHRVHAFKPYTQNCCHTYKSKAVDWKSDVN